jgi:hypothetical protein
MKGKFLFLATCLLLAVNIIASDTISVDKIKITFLKPPIVPPLHLPLAALRAESGRDPGSANSDSTQIQFGIVKDPGDHGAFTNVAGQISALKVTWADPKIFPNENETQNFLRQLLCITNSHTWAFHAWAYGDETPIMVARVEHKAGKLGQWYIWRSPALACAYLDGNGKWWWAMWPQKIPIPFAGTAAACTEITAHPSSFQSSPFCGPPQITFGNCYK